MLGNVVEWCASPYEKYPQKEGDDVEPTTTFGRGMKYVMRGGSFYNVVTRVRSAYRYQYAPDISIENGGFRVARTIE
jgi:formylglycine-generating enzyme required for sulfatase activity